MDTIINIEKYSLEDVLKIDIKRHCVECIHQDSLNRIVRKTTPCSASEKYITEFISGYAEAGNEQNLKTDCKLTK